MAFTDGTRTRSRANEREKERKRDRGGREGVRGAKSEFRDFLCYQAPVFFLLRNRPRLGAYRPVCECVN